MKGRYKYRPIWPLVALPIDTPRWLATTLSQNVSTKSRTSSSTISPMYDCVVHPLTKSEIGNIGACVILWILGPRAETGGWRALVG